MLLSQLTELYCGQLSLDLDKYNTCMHTHFKMDLLNTPKHSRKSQKAPQITHICTNANHINLQCSIFNFNICNPFMLYTDLFCDYEIITANIHLLVTRTNMKAAFDKVCFKEN